MIAGTGKKAILSNTIKPTRLSVNAENIPQVMKDCPRWLNWRYEWRENANSAKWNKVPVQPGGRNASSTDSTTWTDFQTAFSAFRDNRSIDGIGFALGDDWSGVDLDDCRDVDTGVLTAIAESIIKRFASYSEISPTGSGVKIVVRGCKPKGRCAAKDPDIEVYSSGRYFTITAGKSMRHRAKLHMAIVH